MPKSDPHAWNTFGRYRDALNTISNRTRTPLPSLVVSFAVLHELTAIVPLVGIFFGARTLGVGEHIIRMVTQASSPGDHGWARDKGREWVDDGEKWARRVGGRYGIFGFEKNQDVDGRVNGNGYSQYHTGRIAGDVANAAVAYGVTKASIVAHNADIRALTHSP